MTDLHTSVPGPTDSEDTELTRARELLARTMRFLTHCAENPEAALRAEDPRDLVRELQVLALGRDPAPASAPDDPAGDPPRTETRMIQIRHRRSA